MAADTALSFTALAGALAALALSGVAACGSSPGTVGNGAAPAASGDSGVGGDSGTSAGTSVNPYGVPYPAAPASGYGHTARIGSTPGSVIENFKFLGRHAGQPDVTTISLADYYDPCNKSYKILHLSVAAVWCEPCSEETTAVVTDLATSSTSVLDADKIVFIQALDDGPTQGTPATVSDLNYWITSHNSNFTEMLDPGLMNLGGFFTASAIPWNTDIDVRDMEMLDSNNGWAGGTIQAEFAPGVAALPSTPSYPIPASAGCTE